MPTDLDPNHQGPYSYEELLTLAFDLTNSKFTELALKIKIFNQIIEEWSKVGNSGVNTSDPGQS